MATKVQALTGTWNVQVQGTISKQTTSGTRFNELKADLTRVGPKLNPLLCERPWKNCGLIVRSGLYHCHLDYRHVACWNWDETSKTIWIVYVGWRKSAPY